MTPYRMHTRRPRARARGEVKAHSPIGRSKSVIDEQDLKSQPRLRSRLLSAVLNRARVRACLQNFLQKSFRSRTVDENK